LPCSWGNLLNSDLIGKREFFSDDYTIIQKIQDEIVRKDFLEEKKERKKNKVTKQMNKVTTPTPGDGWCSDSDVRGSGWEV
jgi:hypothetical protein